MDFILEHNKLLNIIQILLDFGCCLCNKSVYDLFLKHKVNNLIFYVSSNKIQNKLKKFKNYFKYFKKINDSDSIFECNYINKNKIKWILKYGNNSYNIIFTSKLPKTKNQLYKLLLTKDGLKKIDSKNSIECLKLLRFCMKKNMDLNDYTNLILEWLLLLIYNNHQIYGGWPSRFIMSTNIEDLNRDIDVISEEFDKIKLLFETLEKSKLCTKLDQSYNDGLKMNINFDNKNIIFDIHKKNSNNCDAFYNNIILTEEFISINKIPDKLNFIKTIILTLNDIFQMKYTLIKPFPDKIKNKGDFRLINKPLLMKDEFFEINIDYLNFIDKKIKIEDIISLNDCIKKDHNDIPKHELPTMLLN